MNWGIAACRDVAKQAEIADFVTRNSINSLFVNDRAAQPQVARCCDQ